MNPSLWFFPPWIGTYRVGIRVGGAPGGPQACRAHPRGVGAPPGLVASGWPPSGWFFCQYFLYIPKIFSVNFQVNPRTFISAQKKHHGNSAENSVRVSSIQIMQIRVQNKSKSVWKNRYGGDVSTPPSLTHCLSSSNSVDKLKVIKKNFYELFCSCIRI